MIRPDPVLTANLYGDGLLDELIAAVAGPVLDRARTDIDSRIELWFLRYARGGEHLKLRFHGPASAVPDLRLLVEEIVQAFWATQPPTRNPERKIQPRAVPIDDEDWAREEPPDRSLLWTRYRRSPVSLGPKSFLEDDEYVRHVVSSLVAGTEVLLERSGRPQNLWLQAVMFALRVLRPRGVKRRHYLSYHRDWLIRALWKANPEAFRRGAGLVQSFDRRVEGLGDQPQRLRAGADRLWQATWADVRGVRDLDAWSSSLEALLVYGEKRFGDVRIDPYAGDRQVFVPLFKMIHHLSNQLGVAPIEEAFLSHLLIRALDGGLTPERPVLIEPPPTERLAAATQEVA